MRRSVFLLSCLLSWLPSCLVLALTLVLAACSIESRLTDEQVERCRSVAELAGGVMALRQTGQDRTELETNASTTHVLSESERNLTLAIIETAYDGWEQRPVAEHGDVVTDFSQAWYFTCASSFLPRHIRLPQDPEDY